MGAGAVDAGAHQPSRSAKRDAVAAVAVDRAFVDANDLLRTAGVVAHHQATALAFGPEHERHLGAETVFARGRHERRHGHPQQPRQPRRFWPAARRTRPRAGCIHRRRRNVCSSRASETRGSGSLADLSINGVATAFKFGRCHEPLLHARAVRLRTPASRWAGSRRRRRARRSPCSGGMVSLRMPPTFMPGDALVPALDDVAAARAGTRTARCGPCELSNLLPRLVALSSLEQPTGVVHPHHAARHAPRRRCQPWCRPSAVRLTPVSAIGAPSVDSELRSGAAACNGDAQEQQRRQDQAKRATRKCCHL